MKVVFLGVGEAFDEVQPNTSLLIESSTKLLLDCGFSAAQQLWKYNSEANFLDAIYISHFHADHYFGIPALLMRMWEEGRKKKITLLGQAGIREKILELFELGYPGFLKKFGFELEFLEIKNELDFNEFHLKVAESRHSSKNFALRISCGGKVICYSGDGGFTSEMKNLFTGCDLAISECYAIKPITPNHTSLNELLEFFKEIRPKCLALVHIRRKIETEKILEILRREGLNVILPKQFEKIDLATL